MRFLEFSLTVHYKFVYGKPNESAKISCNHSNLLSHAIHATSSLPGGYKALMNS